MEKSDAIISPKPPTLKLEELNFDCKIVEVENKRLETLKLVNLKFHFSHLWFKILVHIESGKIISGRTQILFKLHTNNLGHFRQCQNLRDNIIQFKLLF